jgi:hypothetical protein
MAVYFVAFNIVFLNLGDGINRLLWTFFNHPPLNLKGRI